MEWMNWMWPESKLVSGAFHSPQTPHTRGLQWKDGTASLVRPCFFLDLYEENWMQNVKHSHTVTETETIPGFKPQWFVVYVMCFHLLGMLVSSPSLLLLLCLFPWVQWLTITFSNRLAYGRNNEHIRFWCMTQIIFFLPVTQALDFHF